jgi:outer membrane biosynthesis protein TonB
MKRSYWMVALALALPGCGGDSSTPDVVPSPVAVASPSPVPSPTPEPSPSPVPSPTPQPTPEPTPEPTPTPEPLPDITINIANMAFSPASVTAKVGQRVVWKNKDVQTHTATADSGEFATGFIDPGGQASITVSSVGEFNYHCSVHPSMKATLTGEK